MARNEIIDLCNTQTIVDLNKFLSEVDGAIIKLGYTGYGNNKPALSPGWKKHFTKLKDTGLPLGIYYFTIAFTEEMVDMETDWVIARLKEIEADGFRFRLPIFLDCEAQNNSAKWTALDKETRSKLMKRWMDNIRKAGYYTGIYAGVRTWKYNTILVTDMLKGYDKWMAQYYSVCQYPGTAGIDYTIWQYTSEVADAGVYGISTSKKASGYGLDVNHCYVDYPKIIEEGGYNHIEKKVTEVPAQVAEKKIKVTIGDDVVIVPDTTVVKVEVI